MNGPYMRVVSIGIDCAQFAVNLCRLGTVHNSSDNVPSYPGAYTKQKI